MSYWYFAVSIRSSDAAEEWSKVDESRGAGTIDFLTVRRRPMPRMAYTLSTIAVDFRVVEAVNLDQMVRGIIPKSLIVNQNGRIGTSRS
jgi:acetamidase/formamidase